MEVYIKHSKVYNINIRYQIINNDTEAVTWERVVLRGFLIQFGAACLRNVKLRLIDSFAVGG